MKKLYALLFSLLFTSISLLANKDGTILLTSRLSGSQEVPVVATKAKGLVTVVIEEDRSLTINGVFDSLSGAVTNCHFHKGVFGVSGGVVLNLLPYVKGNRIYGKVASPSKDLIKQLMTDSIYINVHTAANTGGEIRGQVYLQTDYHLWTLMSGAFEVPAVQTTALGLASVVLSRSLTRVSYKMVVHGLSGSITGAHFHYGSPTTTGPVAYNLVASGNVLQGSIDIDTKFIDSIEAGRVYVNIHTAANAGGEIRGQLGFVNGALAFDGLLEGSNEVPSVTTNAKGLAIAWTNFSLDTLQYAVLQTGLTATAAHFHAAKAGSNGGVIQALTAYSFAPLNAYVARVALTNENLNRFLKDSVYVNIHTAANSGGEIRGQMQTSIHEGTVADLCGKQEVPAVTPTGTGAGYTSIDANKSIGYFAVVTNGLSGNATNAHIHRGGKGTNGSVYLGFGSNINSSNQYSGAFLFSSTTAADSVRDGNMYMNVHTAANAGGEIRGQLGKSLTTECLPTSSIYELNGQILESKVYPNPTFGSVTLDFQSNQYFDARVVIYDLIGRSVLNRQIKVEDGDNRQNIDMTNFTNGIYFLQVKTEKGIIFSEKIVKN